MRSSPRQEDVSEALKAPVDTLPVSDSPRPSGHFRLTRYFSWVSLGLIAAVGLLLTLSMHAQTQRELIHMAERRNEAMTAVFINALGERLRPLLATGSTSSEPAQAVKEAVAAVRQAGYQVDTDQRHFSTTGITCGGCAKSVTTVLSALPGVLAVDVDVPNNTATVEVVKGTVSDESLAAALMPTGYRLLPQDV